MSSNTTVLLRLAAHHYVHAHSAEWSFKQQDPNTQKYETVTVWLTVHLLKLALGQSAVQTYCRLSHV